MTGSGSQIPSQRRTTRSRRNLRPQLGGGTARPPSAPPGAPIGIGRHLGPGNLKARASGRSELGVARARAEPSNRCACARNRVRAVHAVATGRAGT